MQNYLKKISVCLFLSLFVSCKVASIDSKRYKLINLERKGWIFHINSEEIRLEKMILNKQNFKSIEIKKSKKKIYIIQKNQNPDYTNIINLASLDSLGKMDLVVIDGLPYSNLDARNIKIESSAISKLTKLTDTVIIGCRQIKNLIIVTTK